MRVVKPNEEDSFRIAVEFNRREASALLELCNSVGGDSGCTARSITDALGRIFRDAGVQPTNEQCRTQSNSSSFYFKKP